MKHAIPALALLGLLTLTVTAQANRVAGVDRTNGSSGNRSPIGAFTGDTDPLPGDAGGLAGGSTQLYFSDRDYTVNTVPSILEGGELIRTFNTDKGASVTNVNYAVTLGEAASFYVLIDDRFGDPLSIAQSLMTFADAGSVADTGINLIIDEGDGPNQSVFTDGKVYEAGTYNFGGGTGNMGNNYHSIVVTAPVPEPSTIVMAVVALLCSISLIRRR